MCLVASRSGGGYADYIEGEIRRIDIVDNVVQTPTASLGTGCWPRFAPSGDQFAYMDGNTVRICNANGGAIRSFSSENSGNISWTTSGIWVGGNGRITKYDTLGTYLRRYTTNVVQRNYVSQNEWTGSGVSEGDWHPVIYNMRRNASVNPSAPAGAWTAGCSACPSPNGLMVTNNLVENTIQPSNPAEVHRSMRILDTLGNMLHYIRLENATKFTASGYRWDTQCWSSNSNEWIVIPVGQGNYVADQNVSACVYNISTQQKFCLKDNTGTSNYWQPYDYFSGKTPGTAPVVQVTPATLNFAADSGGAAPAVQNATVTTASGSLLGVSVSKRTSWLSVNASGTSGASITVANTVSLAGLRPGTYRDTVSVTTTNASSTRYFVVLTVRTPTVSSVLTTVDVNPPLFTVLTGGSLTYMASARNQVGALMNGVSVSWSVGGGGTITSAGVFTAGTTIGGAHRVIATASYGGVTLRDTALVDISNNTVIHRKIDCGGGTPVQGWEGDDGLVSGGSDWGNPGTVAVTNVAGAAPAGVYKTVRAGSPHTYTVPGLYPNRYTVRLHLADAFDSAQLRRSMSYTIAGVNVLRDFSIQRLAGGINKALAMDFAADLRSGGNLTVLCEGLNGSDVMEGGIEVMENRNTSITLMSPNGGETWAAGQTVTLRWHADTLRMLQVLIELSVDDGDEYGAIIGQQGITYSAGLAAWGSTPWTIPASFMINSRSVSTASSTCRVRIRPYFLNESVEPVSSKAAFTITGSGTVSGGRPMLMGRQEGVSVVRSAQGLTLSAYATDAYTVRAYLVDGRQVLCERARGAGSWRASTVASGPVYVRMTLDNGREYTRTAIAIE